MTKLTLPTDRLREATDRQAGFTEAQRAGDIRDFTPRFFSEEGRPSLDPPEADGFLDATGLRISRGSQQLEGGWAWAVQSIGEHVSDIYREQANISFPAATVGSSLMTSDGPVSLSEATVEQIFDSADDWTKSMLESNGIDRAAFVSAAENDPSKVDDTYRKIVQNIRTNQALASYADQHEVGYFAAGTLATIQNFLDPLTLATVGTGALASQAVKQGVKQSVRFGLRESAKRSAVRFVEGLQRGSFGEAITMAAFPVRQMEYTKLMLPAAAGEGIAFNYMAQLAGHEASLRLGQIEEGTPFQVDPAGLLLSAGLGIGLYGLAYKSAGLKEVSVTPREYLQYNDGSYGATVVRRYVESGDLDMDEVIRPSVLADTDITERVINGLYGAEDAAFARSVLDNVNTPEGVDSGDLALFMSQMPSPSEFRAWVSAPTREATTAWSRASDNLLDTQAALREARARGDEGAIKKAQRRVDELESELIDATNELTLNTTVDDPDLFGKTLTRPLTDISGSGADRLSRTEFLLNNLMVKNRALNGVTSPIYRTLGLFGGDILSPTRSMRNPQDADELMMASIASLIVNDATDVRLAGSRGAALSFREAYTQVQMQQQKFLTTWEKHTRKLSQEDKDDFGAQVLRYVRDQDEDDLDPALSEVAGALREYLDNMRQRGIRNGYFSNSGVENYIPVNLRPDITQEGITTLATRLSRRWKEALYDPDNGEAIVHYGTLHSLGVNKAKQALTEMGFDVDDVATKADLAELDLGDIPLAALPEEFLEDYLNNLDGAIQLDGIATVKKRLGRVTGLPDDPLVKQADQPTRINADSRGRRKIEQDWWLEDANLDDRLVEVDLEELTQFYDRSTGYNIARQESLLDAFGEPVKWEDLTEVLRSRVADGGAKAAMFKNLVQMENVNAGRVQQQDKLFPIRIISGLGRATVNMGVGLPIITTELATTMVQTMFQGKDIVENARLITQAMREADTATLRQMGFGYEVHRNHHRMFGDLRDREILENASGFQGHIGRAVLAYEDLSRKVGGEYALTKWGKSVRFHQGFSVLHFRKGVLDKADQLRLDVPYSSKEFKQSARAAGFGGRADIARDLAEKGLMDPEMIAAARQLRDVDPNALLTLRTAYAAASQLDEADQAVANELIDRLRRYGTQWGEQMITTGDASTMRRFDSDIANLFMQFLSFPQAWYSKTFRRIAESPARHQVGYLGLYISGEMTASMLRDVAFNGHSPETVFEAWEKDPYGEAAKIAARVPFFGPWSQIPQTLISPFVEDPDPVLTPGAAAPSMILRGAGAIKNAAVDIWNGEPVSDSSSRAARRMIPGYNHWIIQLLRGSVSEADADRQ